MTVLINLFGQPSTGKSTTMAELFAYLKGQRENVEMSVEWIKKWAWQGTKPDKYSQSYIYGKESYQQSRLFNKVDYIISDSPVFLTGFYQEHYTGNCTLLPDIKNFYKMAEEDGVKVLNIFLAKNKPYNPKGRFQNEEQAGEIGNSLLEWLNTNNIDFIYMDCSDNKRVSSILNLVGLR